MERISNKRYLPDDVFKHVLSFVPPDYSKFGYYYIAGDKRIRRFQWAYIARQYSRINEDIRGGARQTIGITADQDEARELLSENRELRLQIEELTAQLMDNDVVGVEEKKGEDEEENDERERRRAIAQFLEFFEEQQAALDMKDARIAELEAQLQRTLPTG